MTSPVATVVVLAALVVAIVGWMLHVRQIRRDEAVTDAARKARDAMDDAAARERAERDTIAEARQKAEDAARHRADLAHASDSVDAANAIINAARNRGG